GPAPASPALARRGRVGRHVAREPRGMAEHGAQRHALAGRGRLGEVPSQRLSRPVPPDCLGQMSYFWPSFEMLRLLRDRNWSCPLDGWGTPDAVSLEEGGHT